MRIAAAFGDGQVPQRNDPHRQSAQSIIDLRVAQVVQHVARHRSSDRGRKILEAGDARKHLARDFGGPLARSNELDISGIVERLAAACHPLRQIDQVSGDVGDPFSLNRNVEIPGWTHQRPLVDELVQVVDAFQLDRRLAVIRAESPEHLRGFRQRLLQTRRDVVALGHDVHRQWRPHGRLDQQRQLTRTDQPGLVSEHRELLGVQVVNRAHLRVVLSRVDDDLARALTAKALEKVRAFVDAQVPACRIDGALIESLHDAQKAFQVCALLGIDVNVVCEERMWLAQRERGMEVAGVQDHQGVRFGSHEFSVAQIGAICADRRLSALCPSRAVQDRPIDLRQPTPTAQAHHPSISRR